MDTVVSRNSLVAHFAENLRNAPARPCIWFRRDGEVVELAWQDVGWDAARFAAALRKLGVVRGNTVALASPNRYEWIVCDLAILSIGAIHVPIHASLSGPQMRFQIEDCRAKVVVVAGDEQASKLAGVGAISDVCYAAFDPTTVRVNDAPIPRLVEIAEGCDDESTFVSVAATEPATILYTSGTTGEPKGVVLSHGNLTTNAEAMVRGFQRDEVDRRMNLLPLSHVFARTCDVYTWIVGGSELALADTPQTALADCATFRPTLLNGVPYFYERVMRRLIESGKSEVPGALKQLFGGRMRHCCSGSAPLPEHVASFYAEHGVLLTQGYGLTESSPVITMSTPTIHRVGTVGQAIERAEVRIADDGEILTRGPHVMLGYWNRPKETAAALKNGWLHTGDLGMLDADGFLRITGRKKELIVTSGGKKIVPSMVEAAVTADPLFRQAVVVGDGRNYLTALLVPCRATLASALATAAGESADGNVERPDLLQRAEVRALVEDRLRACLAHLSPYEQVRRFVLLEQEFSVERGELTLTLKLRRAQIAANYATQIERLYAAEIRPNA
ncbi:MAG: AMP-dependent synthetase/ligase [Planctomycetia bacterium]|nr:AMP-dependent synthetase/ligase [Planctomycetia bacterium]